MSLKSDQLELGFSILCISFQFVEAYAIQVSYAKIIHKAHP